MIRLLKNQAKWISSGDKCAQRLYRHTFDTANIKKAKGKITTPQGEVKVKYDENSIKVTVPDGIDAVIRLNNNEINLTTGESIINLQGVRNDQNR